MKEQAVLVSIFDRYDLKKARWSEGKSTILI